MTGFISPPSSRLRIKPRHRLRTLNQENPVELVRFDDGNTYVVKLKQSPSTGTQKIHRDYVSCMLAQYVQLPVPPFGIVRMNDAWVEKHLRPINPHCHSGNQFVSRFIPGVKPLGRKTRAGKVKVRWPEVFILMLVFDLWVGNQDRKRSHVLMTKTAEDGFKEMYLIDHGGTLRSRAKMIHRMITKRSFRSVYKHSIALIRRGKLWKPFVKQIQSVPDSYLDDVFAGIPDDWNVSSKDKEAKLEFLKEGRKLLPEWVVAAIEESRRYGDR